MNDDKIVIQAGWRAVEALSNMFWKRFIQEYLPMLNIRKKWNREKRDFKENNEYNIVLYGQLTNNFG